MRSTTAFSLVLFSAAFLPCSLPAQTPQTQTSLGATPLSPLSTGAHHHQQKNVFEYAFGKINPSNRNYGTAIEAARHSLVTLTVEDVYWWSNCISLSLLVGLGGFCFFQLRSIDKKERVAAALIAQLWNGRISDKVEIERRTGEYNKLVDEHNATVEKQLAAPQPVRFPKAPEEETIRETPRVEMQPGASTQTQTATAYSASTSRAKQQETKDDKQVQATPENAQQEREQAKQPSPISPAAPVSDKAEIEKDQQIRLLKSQVDALKNTEQNLKQRLNSQQEYINQTKNMQPAGKNG